MWLCVLLPVPQSASLALGPEALWDAVWWWEVWCFFPAEGCNSLPWVIKKFKGGQNDSSQQQQLSSYNTGVIAAHYYNWLSLLSPEGTEQLPIYWAARNLMSQEIGVIMKVEKLIKAKFIRPLSSHKRSERNSADWSSAVTGWKLDSDFQVGLFQVELLFLTRRSKGISSILSCLKWTNHTKEIPDICVTYLERAYFTLNRHISCFSECFLCAL